MKSKLQEYLEISGLKTRGFSPEDIIGAAAKMGDMAPALLRQIAKESGYLDMNFESCKLVDLRFGDGGLVAHYKTPFKDEGKRYMGDTFITWNGTDFDMDFGGTADEIGEDDE